MKKLFTFLFLLSVIAVQAQTIKIDTVTKCTGFWFWRHCKTSYDTTIIINQHSSTKVGIMPFSIASVYKATITRDAMNYGYWQIQTGLVKRIKAYNPDSVIININNRNTDSTPADFTKDTSAYKLQVVSFAKEVNAKAVVIENENDNPPYYKGTPEEYCNELTAGVNALAPLGIKVYNGGLIWIRFWYYNQTHDQDFFDNCIPAAAKQALLRGDLNPRIESVQYQLDVMKKLPGLTAVNIHQLYLASTKELAGLKRMIEYIKAYTGKPVMSNEAGFLISDVEILKGMVQLARDENFEWFILYSGDTKRALPISLSQYQAALKGDVN